MGNIGYCIPYKGKGDNVNDNRCETEVTQSEGQRRGMLVEVSVSLTRSMFSNIKHSKKSLDSLGKYALYFETRNTKMIFLGYSTLKVIQGYEVREQ